MSPTRDRAEQLFGLEILRFAAALMVVVYHYADYFAADGIRATPASGALWPVYAYGQIAVPVFWVLSGYVFFWKYNKPIAERGISATQFFILRFSRLYPLHLFTLALVSLLYWASDKAWWLYAMNWPYLIAQFFFASNWFTAQDSFNGPIWSVSIEVLIYAVFFFAARTGRLNTLSTLPLISVASVGGYWITAHMSPVSIPLLNIAACSTCFFLGAALANGREFTATHYRFIAPALSIFSVGLFFYKPTYALVFSIPVAAVFLFSAGPLWRAGSMRRLSRLGDLTYGSYLLHFPIAAALRLIGATILDAAPSLSFFVFYLVLVFSAAAGCFFYFERPVQNAIRGRFLQPATTSNRR